MSILGVLVWWSSILGSLHSTHADKNFIRCYNGSLDIFVDAPLDNPLPILPLLDLARNSTFYSYGYKGQIVGEKRTQDMLMAYLERKDTNLCALAWNAAASTRIEYAAVVLRAKEAGEQLSKALVTLMKNGLQTSYTRLTGHSLGAHVMGWAGRNVQKENRTVARITGLDPAGPLFQKLFGLPLGFDGLKRTDGVFVDAVHTNPGEYGTDEAVGDVDFWANCGPSGRQPGCPSVMFPLLNKEGLCSHDRSWMIYVEALSTPDAFPAAAADTCQQWKAQTSTGKINYVGDNVDPSMRGNFYFDTNAQSPYSKGEAGIKHN